MLSAPPRVGIVLSSAWRLIPKNVNSLKLAFREFQIAPDTWIVDQTPNFYDRGAELRLSEILRWVDDFQPRRWVAVDDADLLGQIESVGAEVDATQIRRPGSVGQIRRVDGELGLRADDVAAIVKASSG